ncbi:MAG: SDR family NAD(P)-dependent oxidoreductase [Rubrivivax sp.]|nr:SDR family NAD(P)-dependent oxidoreductase [Rubrivivax sp.]
MHLSIVTGSSRGLGLALTEQLLQRGHRVLAIARSTTSPPGPENDALEAWRADLADAAPVAAQLQQWLAGQGAASSVTLINNAGVVSTPGPLGDSDLAELSTAIRVGLESAVLLSAAFLHATAAWTVPRKIVLVSSGLGRRAMAGSASYCAAKAGMDHLARAVALEEAARPHGARIVSLAPGIIDTDMQVQLRTADRTRFPERDRFLGFKTAGQLDSPTVAATKLLRYLDRDDFGSNPVGDVRDE